MFIGSDMTRLTIILAFLIFSSAANAFPGSGLLNKIKGGSSTSSTHQQDPKTGTPQKKKGLLSKIKSGVSHAVSAVQCTQAVCSDQYQFTPQKANYCLGTEGKARTNINCAKIFLNGPLAHNPAYSQAAHFAEIAMQKGGSGLGKLTSAVSKVHAIATCNAQKCGNPNAGRNDLVSCLGTPKQAAQNPDCATAYYNTHCAKLHYGAMPAMLPHGVEFCNTISQSRGMPGMMTPHPGMMPGMMPGMSGSGCHGVLTYTLPPGSAAQPMGTTMSPMSRSITANPYDTDGNPNTPY